MQTSNRPPPPKGPPPVLPGGLRASKRRGLIQSHGTQGVGGDGKGRPPPPPRCAPPGYNTRPGTIIRSKFQKLRQAQKELTDSQHAIQQKMSEERDNALRDAEVRRAHDIRKVSRQLRDVDDERRALLNARKQKLVAGTDQDTVLMLDSVVNGFTRENNDEALQTLCAGLQDATPASAGVMKWNQGRSKALSERVAVQSKSNNNGDSKASIPKLQLGTLGSGVGNQQDVNDGKSKSSNINTNEQSKHKNVADRQTLHTSGSQTARLPRTSSLGTLNIDGKKEKPKVWHVPKTARYGRTNSASLVGLDRTAAHMTASTSMLDSRVSGAQTELEDVVCDPVVDEGKDEGDLVMEDVEDGVAMPMSEIGFEDIESVEDDDADLNDKRKIRAKRQQKKQQQQLNLNTCANTVAEAAATEVTEVLNNNESRYDENVSMRSAYVDLESKEELVNREEKNGYEEQHVDEGWQVLWDDKYQSWYYFHEASGVSQWYDATVTDSMGRKEEEKQQQQQEQEEGEEEEVVSEMHATWATSHEQQQQQPYDSSVANVEEHDQEGKEAGCSVECSHSWRIHYTPQGTRYFCCETSGVSQWNDPRGVEASDGHPIETGGDWRSLWSRFATELPPSATQATHASDQHRGGSNNSRWDNRVSFWPGEAWSQTRVPNMVNHGLIRPVIGDQLLSGRISNSLFGGSAAAAWTGQYLHQMATFEALLLRAQQETDAARRAEKAALDRANNTAQTQARVIKQARDQALRTARW